MGFVPLHRTMAESEDRDIPAALLQAHGITNELSDVERLERLRHLRRTLEAVQNQAKVLCEKVTREMDKHGLRDRLVGRDS